MASYYQTKKTIHLRGGYICSTCKSVVLREFNLCSLANSRWSQKKAQEGADLAAEKGINALLAFPEKPFLVTQLSEERTYSLVSGFGTDNLAHSCPYCGNRERWQLDKSFASNCHMDPVSGVYLVTDVPKESRLTLQPSTEALKAWQANVSAANILSIRQYWNAHPAKAVEVRGQIQDLREQIESLHAEKAAVQEDTRLLSENVKRKEEEMKGFSLFSGERKVAKAELNELKKQHSARSESNFARKNEIIKTIVELERQIKALKVANPGILGEMETITNKDEPYHLAIRFC